MSLKYESESGVISKRTILTTAEDISEGAIFMNEVSNSVDCINTIAM